MGHTVTQYSSHNKIFFFCSAKGIARVEGGWEVRAKIGVIFTKTPPPKKKELKEKSQTHTTEDISECPAPAILPDSHLLSVVTFRSKWHVTAEVVPLLSVSPSQFL